MTIKKLKVLEQEHIMYAMDMFNQNKTKVALELGISIKTLYNKLNDYKYIKTGTLTTLGGPASDQTTKDYLDSGYLNLSPLNGMKL